jgi:hypothetical protein
MSTISSAPVGLEDRVGQSWAGRLGATLKRWCVAYIMWRIEQAALAKLYAMSDHHLKGIWLTRSAIAGAVRMKWALARTLSPPLSHPTRRSPPHKDMSMGGGRRPPLTAARQGAGR